MKLKKWLSRGLVLAMVLALMVPVPVAAKSNGGGKLVKSVTVYTPDASGNWALGNDRGADKTSFKYGSKNSPSEITYTNYTTYLGIPVAGSSNTVKIKYKGSKAKEYDTAGFVSGKYTLKNGSLTSWSSERKESWKTEKGADFAELSANVGHASYFKNGLMKASDFTVSYLDSDNISYAYTGNSVYAWTQKKGVPSLMYVTDVTTGKDYDFDEEEYYNYDGSPWTRYAIFNSKGLVIEAGDVVDGKNVPDTAYTYTMKKGKVKEAVMYSIDSKGTPTPQKMWKFAYTKKSVSKTFYLKMMNDLVGCDGFSWF